VSNDLDAIFDGIDAAKPISTWTKNLGVGEHVVVLTEYRRKQSDKEMGNIIEADFVVLESDVHEEGEARGWAWFIDAPGWTGKYNKYRAKDFLQQMGKCIGDERESKAIGADFVSKSQKGRGTKIKVVVTPVMDDDGQPRRRKNGEVIANAEWIPIEQTLDDVKEMRAQLEGEGGADEEQEPEPPPPPKKETKTGLNLKALKNKK
jgi:hypothetical protein